MVGLQPPVNEQPANQNKADRQKNPINSSQDSGKLKINIFYYFVTVLYFRYLKKINSDRNGIALFFFFSSPTSDDTRKLKEPCLSAYGGPINPNLALGGFEGTAYQNASTLIITFVVNNHKDKTKLKKAVAWEKAFIEYMKGYTMDPKNGNLIISFSAERGIQDELDQDSEITI